MMDVFRRWSQNIVFKALFLLIVLSFVVWGVGDIFRGERRSDVAVVGDSVISRSELDQAMREQIERIQQMLGNSLTPEQIQAFGVKERTLQDLISVRLQRVQADSLKIAVSDEAVLESIKLDPAFRDEKGKFSAEHLRNVLRANGMSEADFISMVKASLTENLMMRSLFLEPVFSDFQARSVADAAQEKRRLSVVEIGLNAVAEPADPSDSELQQYYQEHTKSFVSPELRSIRFVVLDPAVMVPEVAVSEAELRAVYEERKEQFMRPERRTVEHLLFDTKEKAQQEYTRLQALPLKERAHLGKRAIIFKQITQDQLPSEVQEVVFSLPVEVLSEPIMSEMGWHLFLVNSVDPSGALSFEEVRADLEKEKKETHRAEMFSAQTARMDEAFAAGKPFTDVASEFNLSIHSIESVSREGKDARGDAVKDLPDSKTLLPLAFSTEAGAVSALTQMPDRQRMVVVQVAQVTPERVKALDEVRGLAITEWKKEKRMRAVFDLAEEVRRFVSEGQALSAVLQKKGLASVSKEVARPSDNLPMELKKMERTVLSPELLRSAFSLPEGALTQAFPLESGGYALAKIDAILPQKAPSMFVDKRKNDLRSAFPAEIAEQYQLYLMRLHPVKIF